MTDDLQTILDRLLGVQKELRETPTDAFEKRVELRGQLLELQAAAAAAARETSTESSLQRYLEQLERRRNALEGQKMGGSWQDGSVGGIGIPAKQTEEFNRRIDEAGDLPALEQEIARIRAKLAAGSGS